jgi:hypothetical protein
MAGSHNYALGRQRVTDRLRGLLDDVAQRDASILELASNHSGYDGWQAGVEFQADAAVTRTRELSGLCWPTKQCRSSAARLSVASSRSQPVDPLQPVISDCRRRRRSLELPILRKWLTHG